MGVTGENEQGLRKIMDMIRFISIAVLMLHYYQCCYAAFREWGLNHVIMDRILTGFGRSGLFDDFHRSKWISLGFLVVSLIGAKGKKNEKINLSSTAGYMISGLALYFISYPLLFLQAEIRFRAIAYLSITSLGYILCLSGGTLLSRIIKLKSNQKDVFNAEAETFPQEERLLENEYSLNLPARYRLKKRYRKSYINFINPARGLMICGSPGSGKSFFVVEELIRQSIQKGFALFIFDFKFDDLSVIAYNHFLKYKNNYKVLPQFYVINFDDLTRTNRCNPIDPAFMTDVTDAVESARTILLGLNKEWIKKEGDFFVESPINFLVAIIWFLKKYNGGEYCTLPHAIELMQGDFKKIFPVLQSEPEIEAYINPFASAFRSKTMDQLQGQVDSARIALARLSSPILYYVLSGNDMGLDINNPEAPKILCIGSSPQKSEVLGPIISLYANRMNKIINQKGKLKCCTIYDEFPTLFVRSISSTIATGRSNLINCIISVQNLEQLKKEYSKEEAEVIWNLCGNIISGQVTGESAKSLSERFGKIMQDRESFSINSNDTSISRSKHLDSAIPPSKIANLSSGEFVGMVADNPDQKIPQKIFHCEIINEPIVINKEKASFKPIPIVRQVTSRMIERNYKQIKEDISNLIQSETERILNDPELSHLLS